MRPAGVVSKEHIKQLKVKIPKSSFRVAEFWFLHLLCISSHNKQLLASFKGDLSGLLVFFNYCGLKHLKVLGIFQYVVVILLDAQFPLS